MNWENSNLDEDINKEMDGKYYDNSDLRHMHLYVNDNIFRPFLGGREKLKYLNAFGNYESIINRLDSEIDKMIDETRKGNTLQRQKFRKELYPKIDKNLKMSFNILEKAHGVYGQGFDLDKFDRNRLKIPKKLVSNRLKFYKDREHLENEMHKDDLISSFFTDKTKRPEYDGMDHSKFVEKLDPDLVEVYDAESRALKKYEDDYIKKRVIKKSRSVRPTTLWGKSNEEIRKVRLKHIKQSRAIENELLFGKS